MKKAVLLMLGVMLAISLLVSSCTPGHSVYYLRSVTLIDNQLLATTVEYESIRVVNIEKNLTVTVDPECPGTALIVKYWGISLYKKSDAGESELVVRTQQQKEIWEKAIQKELEEYQQERQPREVLPPGYVEEPRPFLGIHMNQLRKDGAEIIYVMQDSPAEMIDLQIGDVIVAIDGQKVSSGRQLQEIISHQYKPRDEITLTIFRNGEEIEISVVLGETHRK